MNVVDKLHHHPRIYLVSVDLRRCGSGYVTLCCCGLRNPGAILQTQQHAPLTDLPDEVYTIRYRFSAASVPVSM